MTPHAIIESMTAAVKEPGGAERLRDMVDLSVWPDVLRALSRAVHFEMGEARPTEPHEEFAFDLFERDLFQPPFPVTFWTGQVSPNAGFLLSADDPVSWRPTGDHAGGERGLGIIVFGRAMRGTEQIGFIPMVSGRVSHTPLGADGPIRFSWRSISQGARSYKTGVEYDEDRYAGVIDKASRFMFGSTAMLMTPDIEQKIETAPRKLNAAREKKGRPPITERRVITIKAYAREALSGTAAVEAFDGRRGPRPHMRRGHFRTLARGSETERVIPVAPCVVGVSDDVRATIRPKQYVVKAEPAA